jgi:membrane protein YqaA with SNARE-associated domain
VIRKSYDRMMELAESRHAVWWLGVEAFCEGIFFPIPPDLMLMPMALAHKDRAFLYAGITTVASIAGGSVGYMVGLFLQPVGEALLAMTGHTGGLDSFRSFYNQFGLFIMAMPIPFKLIAIASGLAHFNYFGFIAAAAVLRGARFFLEAWLLRHYGAPIRKFIEERLALVLSGAALAVLAAVFMLKFIGASGPH